MKSNGSAIAGQTGFDINADNVELRGLVIRGFGGGGIVQGTGIYVTPTTNNFTLVGSHIGTNAAGTSGDGMRWAVVLDGGTGHVIGGSTVADRNVISGNDVPLFIKNATNATVTGNYIGVDATGLAGLGNGSILASGLKPAARVTPSAD